MRAALPLLALSLTALTAGGAQAGDDQRPALDARALATDPAATRWVFEGCAADPAGLATAPAQPPAPAEAATDAPARLAEWATERPAE